MNEHWIPCQHCGVYVDVYTSKTHTKPHPPECPESRKKIEEAVDRSYETNR